MKQTKSKRKIHKKSKKFPKQIKKTKKYRYSGGMEDEEKKPVLIPNAIVNETLDFFHKDLKKTIHKEGIKPEDLDKQISIEVIMKSGTEEYYKDLLLSERFKNNLCKIAARTGYLSTLIWARQNDCPWNQTVTNLASLHGHIDILEWAIANGCPSSCNGICENACEGGHIRCLEIARDKGCNLNDVVSGPIYIQNAARGGHIECITWLRQHGVRWDRRACKGAADGGKLETLIWLREQGCPWDKGTCSSAARSGHLDCLVWAHENDCPWNFTTCEYAAINGKFECLKWAHEHQCPWNGYVTLGAARTGQLECLIYAVENNCPFELEQCREAAQHYNHQNILEWLNSL